MAVSSNRSPSPSPATSRSNPNTRNSEINNTVRRSFSGNPFTKPSIVANLKGFDPVTPANSPSDFQRRHSMGKEGGVSPHPNEKENAKPVRIRSPAVSKGTKNFMSPTISAASKITASPRKKVLVERNELIRTSVSSSSDGKSIRSSLNLQEVVEDLNSKPASSDSTVTDFDQREAACSSPSKPYDKAEEVLDSQVSKSKNDSEFLSETIADQTLPPYDPKTNYLSPRPRFLHYKPNPRVEKFRLRECNQLEDCFTSESLSDTETTEEAESENSSSVEESEAALEETAQVEPNVSEPRAIEEKMVSKSHSFFREAALEETAQVEPNVSEPRAIEAKMVSKSHSFFRLKPISLMLFLLLVGVCLWRPITESPLISSVIDSSIGKESSFNKLYEPVELAEYARTNFDRLTRNFRLWSTNTVSYLSKMIPTVKESNEMSILWVGNFTVSVKEQNLQWPMMEDQGNLITEAYGKGVEVSLVNPEFEEPKLTLQADQTDLEQIQEEYIASDEIVEANLSLPDEVVEPLNSEEQQTEEGSKLISHEVHSILAEKEQQEGQVSLDSEVKPEADKLQGEEKTISDAEVIASHLDHEAWSIIAEKEQEAQVSELSEIKSALPQTEKLLGENKLISDAEVESSAAVFEPKSSESEDSQSFKEKSSDVNVLGFCLLILSLTVAAALILAKQQKPPTPSAPAIPIDQLLTKKLVSMPTESVENTHQERLSSRNWPTEVDMVGESCPSEMSSFQRTISSYCKTESKGASEAQSQERGLRKNKKRESLASSSEYSMGSPSYGSYTSYEKIHSKQGCGDQEVVTPVRRSSRFRNQVVSS